MAVKEEIKKIKSIKKDQFELLYEISKRLNTFKYEEGLIEETLDLVINVVEAERGLFAKYNESTNNFEIIVARNLKKETITDLKVFLQVSYKRL